MICAPLMASLNVKWLFVIWDSPIVLVLTHLADEVGSDRHHSAWHTPSTRGQQHNVGRILCRNLHGGWQRDVQHAKSLRQKFLRDAWSACSGV